MKFFFDMDGVLTNLYEELSRDCGVSVSDLYEFHEETEPLFLDWCLEKGGFEATFGGLEPNRLDDMKVLMRTLHGKGHVLEVLTSLGAPSPKDMRRAASIHSGKVFWMRTRFGDILDEGVISRFNLVTSGSQKAFYAAPDTVLIDDTLEVVESFRYAGGQAHHYRAWDHDECVREILGDLT